MNNLKKLGVTALASSLVAVSAQAGEMAVNGSANFTYKTNSASEGKGIGTDKGLTVSGSGELDNGWTFSTYTYLSDTMTMSSHATSLTMGSLGTITAGQGWGGNSGGFDEEVPQAYEQVSDLSAAGSSNSVGTFTDNGGITWAVPSFDLGGASASLVLGYTPNGDDAATNNGGVGTRSGTWGAGYDAGLTISTDMGLTVGVYGATRENDKPVASGEDNVRDEFNGVWYAKYAMGPVSVGYSHSYLDSGVTGSAEATTTAKVIRTAAGIFEETQISIAFNVNDNVSISYTDAEDEYNAQDNASTAVAAVSQDSEALQIAYSMGGMSVKAYQMERTNPGYDGDAKKHSASEISIGLAF
jgi:outer membrane protein OmpU